MQWNRATNDSAKFSLLGVILLATMASQSVFIASLVFIAMSLCSTLLYFRKSSTPATWQNGLLLGIIFLSVQFSFAALFLVVLALDPIFLFGYISLIENPYILLAVPLVLLTTGVTAQVLGIFVPKK